MKLIMILSLQFLLIVCISNQTVHGKTGGNYLVAYTNVKIINRFLTHEIIV